MLSKNQEKEFSFFKKELPKKNSLSKNIFHLIVRPYLVLSTMIGAILLTLFLLTSASSFYHDLNGNSKQAFELSLEQQKAKFNSHLYSYRNLDKHNFIIALGQDKTNIKLVTDSTVQFQLKLDDPFNLLDLLNYTVEFKNNKIYKIYIENPTQEEQAYWMKTNNVIMTLRGAENIQPTPSDKKIPLPIDNIQYRQLIVQFIK